MRILPILPAVCLLVSLQGWTCAEGNDVLEALLLLPNGPEFDEDFGSFLACVELNRSPNDEVTITIMSTQASIQPALVSEDYVSVNEILTFTNMTTNLTQCVNVEIVDDEVPELVEFFSIVISSNNVSISGTGSQVITIFDGYLVKVEFEKSEFTVTEGGVPVQVCAVVDATIRDVHISITSTDITTTESDYNKLMDFTIPMGEPSACSPLTAVADGVVEHTETLLVSIHSDAEDVSGNAIVVIIDVDGANVTLVSQGLSVQERNSGESSQVELCVRVEAVKGPLERDVELLLNTAEGTADSSDFEFLADAAFIIPPMTPLGSTVCYNITITGDDVQEVNEMFTITVRTVNGLDQIIGADTVNVTILQNSIDGGEGGTSNNLGAIIGGVVGALFVCALTIAAVTVAIGCPVRRRTKEDIYDSVGPPMVPPTRTVSVPIRKDNALYSDPRYYGEESQRSEGTITGGANDCTNPKGPDPSTPKATPKCNTATRTPDVSRTSTSTQSALEMDGYSDPCYYGST